MSLRFICNVCGSHQVSLTGRFEREGSSCNACGSSWRNRAVIDALSHVLWGTSIPLPEFPLRKDIRGIGLSDWEGYALRLADRLDYLNTFFHTHPKVDICAPPNNLASSLDFLISSDVFEHTLPPASQAFEGSFKVLKPGGWLILTVPYFKGRSTLEHYPDLQTFSTILVGDQWVLVNRKTDGSFEVFPDPVFHGGPGTTVEVRQFGEGDLLGILTEVGFQSIEILPQSVPEYGLAWESLDHRVILARRPQTN